MSYNGINFREEYREEPFYVQGRINCLDDDDDDVNLLAESVNGTSLPLKNVDDAHSRDSFLLGVLSVGYSIENDVFYENLENITSFLVDQT